MTIIVIALLMASVHTGAPRSNRFGRRCVCKGMRRLGTALSLTSITLTVAVGTAVAGLLSTPPSAGAATGVAPASTVITRSAHIAYLSCPEPDVLLTASIQRRPFVPGQLVTYKVSIRDLSQRPCDYANGVTVPTHPVNPTAGLLGPCGELSVVVENSRGAHVFPEFDIGCPVILGPPLGAGQTITTTGTWSPSPGSGVNRPFAPAFSPGEYRVVIDGKVTLPVDLAGPSVIPEPPATLPPRSSPVLPTPLPNLPAPTLPTPTVPSQLPTPGTVPLAPTTPATPRHPVSRSAHVAFDGCSAKNVTLTVTIRAGSSTSAPVRYDVTVHNAGGTPCGAAYRSDPPAVRQFKVGACSSLPATFVNARGVDVYPGPQIYMCPMFAGPYIAPHATVTTTASWAGSEYLATPAGSPQSRPAPPGPYQLVVDDAVEVPFTLTSSP